MILKESEHSSENKIVDCKKDTLDFNNFAVVSVISVVEK